jgi:hypothetical protein
VNDHTPDSADAALAATPAPGDQLAGRAYLRLVLLGALIGIPAALLAAGFLAFVHEAQHWLWDDLPHALGASSPPWYLVIGLPVVGRASFWPHALSCRGAVAIPRSRESEAARPPSRTGPA